MTLDRGAFARLAAALALVLLSGSAAAASPAVNAGGEESPASCAHVRYALQSNGPRSAHQSPPNPDGATRVGLAFFVTELREIDAVRDDYAFAGYVRATWCDPRLAFDPAVAGVSERVRDGPDADAMLREIWFPAAFPLGRVGRMEVSDRVIRVRADGTVQSDIIISLRVSADFDLRRFPFDRQRLELAVESRRWTDEQLLFVAEPEATDFAHDFSIPEWRIERVGTRVESSYALRNAKPFSRIVLEIDVARQWGFYLWKILLPLIIIVSLSWSIFWMTEERVAGRSRITATGVLTIVAYQFVVGEDLPRIAYLTLLDKVMITSFVLLAVTVVQSLIVSRYQDDDMPRAVRIDRMSRLIFPGTYATLLLIVTLTAGR